jgi:hypothetical protein
MTRPCETVTINHEAELVDVLGESTFFAKRVPWLVVLPRSGPPSTGQGHG